MKNKLLKKRCNKRKFDTPFDAMVALHDIRHKKERMKKHSYSRRTEKRSYLCPYCKHYHLTSGEKRNGRG